VSRSSLIVARGVQGALPRTTYVPQHLSIKTRFPRGQAGYKATLARACGRACGLHPKATSWAFSSLSCDPRRTAAMPDSDKDIQAPKSSTDEHDDHPYEKPDAEQEARIRQTIEKERTTSVREALRLYPEAVAWSSSCLPPLSWKAMTSFSCPRSSRSSLGSANMASSSPMVRMSFQPRGNLVSTMVRLLVRSLVCYSMVTSRNGSDTGKP
jgi:hypothetical protein